MPTRPEAEDLPSAILARDAGIARAVANAGSWIPWALFTLRGVPAGEEGVFEHFRLLLEAAGVKAPSHKAWGALARISITHGYLEKTGYRAKMQTKRSHARESDVLRRTRKS
jgi:hypothetical protein